MKFTSINKIVDFKVPQKSNEFLALEKYQNQQSLLVKYDAMHPPQPPMPTQSPYIKEHPKFGKPSRTFADLTSSDWDMLQVAYEKAIAYEIEKRTLQRDNLRVQKEKNEDQRAIALEVEAQRHRIFMSWLQKFHMQDVFLNLKINSLDELKTRIDLHIAKSDRKHAEQRKIFLRQFGLDPNYYPNRINDKYTDRDADLIIRFQTADERSKLINLEDIRHKMALLQVATNLAMQEAAFKTSGEQANQARDLILNSDKKIRGIK